MSVRMYLHPDMWDLADNNEIVEVAGQTVGECLDKLIVRYPGLKDLIFYKDGSLQTFIEIFVNRRVAYHNELEWVVEDGDEIHLSMTIAGG
jgi:molybdopterin converting factor small subunit